MRSAAYNTMYDAQHTTHNTQHTMRNTQFTTYNIQHTISNSQYTIMQCSTQSRTHTTHNVHHTTRITQRTSHNAQHTHTVSGKKSYIHRISYSRGCEDQSIPIFVGRVCCRLELLEDIGVVNLHLAFRSVAPIGCCVGHYLLVRPLITTHWVIESFWQFCSKLNLF